MEFNIIPYKGVEVCDNGTIKGLLSFGMSREDVRTFLKEEPISFVKEGKKKIPTDSFDESGFLSYYNEQNYLEAIEFFLSDVTLYLNSDHLTGLSNSQLREMIEKHDPNLIDTDCGFDSILLGLATYSPDPETDDFEGLMIFQRGYLD